MRPRSILATCVSLATVFTLSCGQADEIKVLTAGAMKQVVLAAAPDFQKSSGHTLMVENDTAGALTKRIEGGADFDVAIISPGAIDGLIAKEKISNGTRTNIARVGIGVMVKSGAPKPDIDTLDAFKRALLATKSVGIIDPASGGSSGIYLVQLFERLGIADAMKSKLKLKQGGYVADLVSSGEAEIGIHQISEILPAAGVTFVGPLPAEVQNYTVYAGGLGAGAKNTAGGTLLIKWLAGPSTEPILKTKGMERPAS